MGFTTVYYISVLTVCLGASTQFYSYGIINPEQELLTDWINRTYMNRTGVAMSVIEMNVFWSFVVSSIAIGAIAGALLCRTLAEWLGRRNALIANGVFNVIGALFEYLAKPVASPEFLIVGRLILGANMGLTTGLVPMYLMEITPTNYRGAAGTLHMVAVAFSDWFSLLLGLPEVLGGPESWPLAFAFPGILALGLCCILPFCPESPKYTLMTRGDRERTKADLKRLMDDNQAREMFESLIKEAALSTGEAKFWQIFVRRQLRIPLLISVIIMVAQQFTGCSVIFAYSTDMFLNAQLSPQVARYSTLAVGVAYFMFACSAPFLIERVGRRALLIFQLSFCSISMALLSIFMWIQNATKSNWVNYATIGAMIFYMCVYGVGCAIPWMITSEIFPTKFRSAAVTVAITVAWTMSFVTSTAYLPFQQWVGISLSYVPFVVICVLGAIFVYFLLPETSGKQASEIVSEIRFRVKSISRGRNPTTEMATNSHAVNSHSHTTNSHATNSHPPHSYAASSDPMVIIDERAALVNDDDGSEYSYHGRYMSMNG